MLNDANRRQADTDEYIDFDAGKPVMRRLTYRLASEQEALDGAIVIRAETDGVNLFLRSLDIPLEDAQAATDAVGHEMATAQAAAAKALCSPRGSFSGANRSRA